jgi:acetyl esterase/lipase
MCNKEGSLCLPCHAKQDRTKNQVTLLILIFPIESFTILTASERPTRSLSTPSKNVAASLIHARNDISVAIKHARTMDRALRQVRKKVELLALNEGEHSLHLNCADENGSL